ncbi:hypothetical protein [Ectobacillus polymachus]|uniref:hypothetical protein n=1 Tax=Ectobacillus polymachus TaxID=1508806 RepID=UPI003A87E32F
MRTPITLSTKIDGLSTKITTLSTKTEWLSTIFPILSTKMEWLSTFRILSTKTVTRRMTV